MQVLDESDLFIYDLINIIERLKTVDFICAQFISEYAPFLVESTRVKYKWNITQSSSSDIL